MKRSTASLLGLGVLAGLLGTLAWQRQQRHALEARLAIARERVHERDQTVAKNERLALAVKQLSALKRLRDDRLAYDARWSPDPSEPLAPGYISRADLANKGNATPKDAYETYWWALDRLDIATLAKLFYFQPESRKGMDAYFATLPEEIRSQYGDATMLFATLYAARHPLNFTGAQVTQATVPADAPYYAKVDTSFEYDDGQTRDHPGDVTLLNPDFKTKSEWRLYGSLGEFKSLVRSLTASTVPAGKGTP